MALGQEEVHSWVLAGEQDEVWEVGDVGDTLAWWAWEVGISEWWEEEEVACRLFS